VVGKAFWAYLATDASLLIFLKDMADADPVRRARTLGS
jgi:hypothetical protein